MRLSTLCYLFLAPLACRTPAPEAAAPPGNRDQRPALLQALDGWWRMEGDVLGEAVAYDAWAGPTLRGAFTEIHMLDSATPPAYEARIFLAADPESGEVIAHWLDSFGGPYSIPHGSGELTGNRIVFTVPYPERPFRDTFTFDPGEETWSLVIEARGEGGDWQHFAAYRWRRTAPLPSPQFQSPPVTPPTSVGREESPSRSRDRE